MQFNLNAILFRRMTMARLIYLSVIGFLETLPRNYPRAPAISRKYQFYAINETDM